MKDEMFIRDKVPMTKESIRSISIDKLELNKAQRFLDVGAGTGSVSLQAAKLYPEIEVVAIEMKELAIDLIRRNCQHFDLTNIEMIQGKAPLPEDLGSFQAIFVGGSSGNLTEIVDWSYQLLETNCPLVMNFILIENALEAFDYLTANDWTDIDMISVSVSDYTSLGKGHYFKPQNPTIILSAKKGRDQ
ncbi:decarboxylating cobalt-precorrin-6B (C(15))-methyltransferase [Facklamia lactis]|uniref:decarboxylating cobalt-precorrin-6B (C(15))-methyltransferase n=1 Tax=Facklamia lactis TaxID=2749967 RepID=UPI0018CE2F1B|nr:decarboxylating cobalt-precorrin-6B (C(15))-methyltransferase [Facklamia lactis]MBG9979498.1 decarboxylating cobalt-precorrin-6B (C(15))-methyltransferase [Facklamia lactis]